MTEHRLYYAYARHALVTALALVRVGRGNSVLVPDFICRDVLASLSAVGAEAHFYSIGNDLQISSNVSLPDVDAIIAVNYFGFPADLARIRGALPSPDIAIIEDNAHGWLSRDEHGVLLGTRTEVSITSIRKTIRVPDGASLEWRAGAISTRRHCTSPFHHAITLCLSGSNFGILHSDLTDCRPCR